MRDIAAQFLTHAQKQSATFPLVMGHRLMGIALLCTGDMVQGQVYSDQALALYDVAEHRPLAARFGQDARVAALSYRSLALWMLGYPNAALADTEQALKDAREIGHIPTLMYGLTHASITYLYCGDYTAASAQADQVKALAIAMPSLSHQTESLERLKREFGLAKGTPLSVRMARGRPNSLKTLSKTVKA
jgi:predicted ATPase